MIKRIYIDNFKSLVNFELNLRELTLLVGPNGVGKTAVLDVVFALRQLLAGIAHLPDKDKPAESVAFETTTLTRWQDRPLQTFELEAVLAGQQFQYRLEVEHDKANRRARVALERLTMGGQPLFTFQGGEVQLYRDNHSMGPVFGGDWSESALARVPPRQDNTHLSRFLAFMRKVIVCGVYPGSFRAESSTAEPVLQRDAKNFAAWYQHLSLERQDLVPELSNALREVITGFHAIRMEPVGQSTWAMIAIFNQHGKKYELRLDELSDGQRALIALYTLVRLSAGQGYTLMLDEPDNYVALAEIQPWLVELADACGGEVPQAILCSHHPELIDYLGTDRGVALEREISGVTRAKALADTTADDGLKLSERMARGWQS